MKKYLMTGIAALAMCAAFTSCSKDTEFEPLTQEQLDQQKAEQITLAYNQAFVKTFGQPASNQTWGFGTATRAEVNVNGNLWESRPSLGETEEEDVLNYMDMTLAKMDEVGHLYAKEFPENLVNYFVTQVHTGDDMYGTAQNPNQKTVLGSSKMNNLHIAMIESVARPNGSIKGSLPGGDGDWEHVNNFNAGTSKDWGGNTMFINSGTFDFAYENSDDSKYHNKWIVVKGSDINAEKYGNYYYVCFDFEGVPNECKTYYDFYYTDANETRQHANGEIEGYFETLQDLKDAGITTIHTYGGQDINVNAVSEFTISRWGQDNMLFRGDNNYSDWIIRLVAATPKNTYDGRIMAEDLCAQEGSDFDFNDVVFDWKVIEDGDKAKIKLLAAGGTMPLRIGGTKDNENSGVEVHGKFGVNPGIMVNTATDDAPRVVVKSYQEFEILASEANLSAFAADGSNIPIYVKKDGVWVELTAYQGAPAAKFNCPVGTKWVDEYANIVSAYPDFANYVSQPGIEWWKNVVPRFVNLLISDNN